MRILFEDYMYETRDVDYILGDFMLSGLNRSKKNVSLNQVGYFYSREITNQCGQKGDLVFILPKVLLDENGYAFGQPATHFLHFDSRAWRNSSEKLEGGLTKRQVYDFVYGFSTWIYRALDIYRKNLKCAGGGDKNRDADNIEESVEDRMNTAGVRSRGNKTEVTLMDVMLGLLDFQKQHKNFILFILKTQHSGFNKISWQKTVAKSTAIIQDEVPVYINPVNKKRVINFDEELLILYYSILNYISEEYGFPQVEQPGYELIKGARFQALMGGVGAMRLRRIKNKYFSDNAVLLWNLCYAFFEKSSELRASTDRKDYLLVNSFHTVFEAMIDELIGDKNLPEGLKVHGDDKRIDHLYTYKYLMENMNQESEPPTHREIYNIADSKYYKRNAKMQDHDVPKQFTYARNVIQWHMDLMHDILGLKKSEAAPFIGIQLYDEVTDGFNIIPNFFVSAKVNNNLQYDEADFDRSTINQVQKTAEGKIPWKKDGNMHESFFFWERLFDRNTLFTLHYDVNFLFVLKMYAQNRTYSKEAWKEDVREKFRGGLLDYLNDNFRFYQINIPEGQIAAFVDEHYRKLQGKVFSFDTAESGRVLLYAERKTQNETDGYDGKAYKHDDTKHAHIDHTSGALVIPGKDNVPWKVSDVVLGDSGYIRSCPKENDTHPLPNVTEFVPVTRKEPVVKGVEVAEYQAVDFDSAERYVKFLPQYDIKVACGTLEDEGVQTLHHSNADIKCWRDVSGLGFKVNEHMFIIEAKGRSMLPTIEPGDLCVFELYGTGNAGSRSGKIVLATCPSRDVDYLCSYTIKKYYSEWEQTEVSRRQTKIELIPLNKDEYETIELSPEDTDHRTFGIYRGKL